jgi:hypothetical protein
VASKERSLLAAIMAIPPGWDSALPNRDLLPDVGLTSDREAWMTRFTIETELWP